MSEAQFNAALAFTCFDGTSFGKSFKKKSNLRVEIIAKERLDDFKKKVVVEFQGEQGLDDGGLSKEFFLLLIEKLFNPDSELLAFLVDLLMIAQSGRITLAVALLNHAPVSEIAEGLPLSQD
ncbi:uncharacterized protein LOC136025751 [Artemia franciscana]|uniref:uncharacterized protein LOC136025751 n=1 Tax=Artemia franciscana TaxID=6661 RepID=UPI0032DB63E0